MDALTHTYCLRNMISKLFILAQLVVASFAVPDAPDMSALPELQQFEKNILPPGALPPDLYDDRKLDKIKSMLSDSDTLSDTLP